MRSPGKLVRLVVSIAIASALGIAAGASAEPTVPGAHAGAAGKRAKVKVLGSQYGPILFTGRGQALYLFRRDGKRRSNCYGDCAAAWPPLLTRGKPIAGLDARQDLLGTTRRRGGARQVTYRGHPLYTYAHEGRRQVLCHDVFLNGGLWLALQRNGKPAP
jgi:predicted lipoprotein with Yx(FWY)xxD motif